MKRLVPSIAYKHEMTKLPFVGGEYSWWKKWEEIPSTITSLYLWLPISTIYTTTLLAFYDIETYKNIRKFLLFLVKMIGSRRPRAVDPRAMRLGGKGRK
jgi:hypothetical protein